MNIPPASSPSPFRSRDREAAIIAIITAQNRRHTIISAIEAFFGLNDNRIRSTIAKVTIPQTLGACHQRIMQINSESSGGGGHSLDVATGGKLLMMFNLWVDYNLWAQFFCRYIHQPQFGELENMDPEHGVFLENQEFEPEAEGAKGKRVQLGETHREAYQKNEGKGASLAGED